MAKWSLVLALFFSIPLTASADTTKEEIIKLAKAGISDEVIITFVKRNPLYSDLTSDDIIELKKAGVSDNVLSSLLAKTEPAPAPVQKEEQTEVFPGTTPRTRIVEKVYVQEPRTVYYNYPTQRQSYYTYPSQRRTYYTYPTTRYYTPSYYSSYSYPSNSYRRYRSSRCGPTSYSPYYNSTTYRSGNWSFGVNWLW